MPSNRRTQTGPEKRLELINAARQLFIEEGYEATSINRIAQCANITTNTIYWYFKDKDELLVAVLEELHQEDLVAFASEAAALPHAQQLAWLVARLRPIRSLVTTVHSRAKSSDSVRSWHERLHVTLEALIVGSLSPAWTPQRRAAEIAIASFTLEGLISHDVDDGHVVDVCNALVEKWLQALPASS